MNRVTLLAALDEKMLQLGYRNPLVLPVDPVAIAEKEGIKLEYSPLHDTTVAGILFNDGVDARILLNSLVQQRWICTLMHELIHFWFHPIPRGVYCDRQGSHSLWDIQANYCAAEALMPAAAVREIADQFDYNVRHTAHVFGVPAESMAGRFNELGLTKPAPRKHTYVYQTLSSRMAAEESLLYRTLNNLHMMSPSRTSNITGVGLASRKRALRGEIV